MKRKLLFIAAILAWSYAGARPPEPRRYNLSIFFTEATGDFKTLIIPIKRIQNLIVIEARVDTVIGNFVLDTGSPELVLNKTYFRSGWEVEDKVSANATGTSSAPIIRTRVGSLNIKDLYFENIQADLNDLGHIENQRGVKILGLLGVDLFTSFEIVIDQYKSVMYLHRLDQDGNVPEEERIVKSKPMMTTPFRLLNNSILLDVTINHETLTFCLDTGAEVNALSNLISPRLLTGFRIRQRMELLGAGGSSAEVIVGTLDEFVLGNRPFRNMDAAITRLGDLGKAYGTPIGGILGNNFLVKGIISINFVTKELCLYPFDVSKP